jgi:2'-5' RNA ligase
MNDTTRITVCLLPPRAVAEQAIAMSKKLSEHGGMFTLGNSENIPHVTLYMTDIPTVNLALVIRTLQAREESFEPCLLVSRTYRQKENGFVDIAYETSPALLSFQKLIVDALNNLRNELPGHEEAYGRMSPEHQKNVRVFGYPEVDTDFEPHLTFSRLPRESAIDTTQLPPIDFSFTLTRLALTKTGPNGTSKEVLYAKILRD